MKPKTREGNGAVIIIQNTRGGKGARGTPDVKAPIIERPGVGYEGIKKHCKDNREQISDG